MSVYAVLLFLHIAGALALFAGIGLELAGLAGLRRARTIAQVREWVGILSMLRRIDGPAAGLILASGLYLALTGWGREAWIALGLLALVAMAGLGIGVTRRRVGVIAQMIRVAGDGPVPSSLHAHLRDPALRLSASLRVALGVGVVFLMAVKPGTLGALAALGVALLTGAVLAARNRTT
jgi:hypothetical protein